MSQSVYGHFCANLEKYYLRGHGHLLNGDVRDNLSEEIEEIDQELIRKQSILVQSVFRGS